MKQTTVDHGTFARNVAQLLDDTVDHILTMRPGDKLVVECREDGIVLEIQPGLFRDQYESTADVLTAELAEMLRDG